jgi:5'(3')-deoxyribonucleotidase
MKTILLDCDGVLADCATPIHRAAERALGRSLPTPKDWFDFEFHISMGLDDGERFRLYEHIHEEDCVGWHVAPYLGAVDFVEDLLVAGYDVAAVTAHWTLGGVLGHWVPARCELIKECFFDIPVVFTHHKARVRGDFLLDDGAHNASVERGILFDQPWNRNHDHPRRARSYAEVLELVSL